MIYCKSYINLFWYISIYVKIYMEFYVQKILKYNKKFVSIYHLDIYHVSGCISLLLLLF